MPRSLTSLLAAAVCLLALTFAAPAMAADAAPAAPQKDELLFSQSSPRAILEPTACRCDGRYILTLRHVDKHTVWFSDRPNRHAGHMATRNFARSWSSYGFASDPPDAALSALDGSGHRLDVVIELTHPRYDAKRHSMRYVAQSVPYVSGSLESEHSTDGLTGRFDDVSLFIDDGTARVVNGCLLVPFTDCRETDRRRGANLSGANLLDTGLVGANFRGADQSDARDADPGTRSVPVQLATERDGLD